MRREKRRRDGSFSSDRSFESDWYSDGGFSPEPRRWVRRRSNESSPEIVRPTAGYGQDRISELPDSVLIHILSSLPLTDAIATAALSRRWRFLWKSSPNLVFSEDGSSHRKAHENLFSFINKALLLHERSPINRFSVESIFNRRSRSTVDVWLRVATARNVEEIELLFYTHGFCRYILPQHMYTNSSLVRLSLSYCGLKPNAVVSWPSLKTLSISNDNDKLNDSLTEIMLSGCPALESLELRKCRGISKLNIRSASLKKLVLSHMKIVEISAPKVESLSILHTADGDMSLNLPSVVHATLDFEFTAENDGSVPSYTRSRRLVTYLLETLDHLQYLTIGEWFIQVLSVMEMQKLTSPVFMGKCLTLNTMLLRWEVPGIANLLRQSVSLETLVINMDVGVRRYQLALRMEDDWRNIFDEFHEKLDSEKYWNSQEGGLVNCITHLKTVKIIEDTNTWAEETELLLELLQIFLKNSRMLEKVIICSKSPSCDGPLNSVEVAKKLLSFPKVSPAVVILYQVISE